MFESCKELRIDHAQGFISLIRNTLRYSFSYNPAILVEDDLGIVYRTAVNSDSMADVLSTDSHLNGGKGSSQRTCAVMGPHYKVYLHVQSLLDVESNHPFVDMCTCRSTMPFMNNLIHTVSIEAAPLFAHSTLW